MSRRLVKDLRQASNSNSALKIVEQLESLALTSKDEGVARIIVKKIDAYEAADALSKRGAWTGDLLTVATLVRDLFGPVATPRERAALNAAVRAISRG